MIKRSLYDRSTGRRRHEVVIKTIPNNSQRYETIGDWWYDKDGTLQIRISEFDEPRYSMAVALHELFEAFAATNNKHTEEEVTKFDLWFEDQLKEGKVPDSLDEPGMHPKCPITWSTNMVRLLR